MAMVTQLAHVSPPSRSTNCSDVAVAVHLTRSRFSRFLGSRQAVRVMCGSSLCLQGNSASTPVASDMQHAYRFLVRFSVARTSVHSQERQRL